LAALSLGGCATPGHFLKAGKDKKPRLTAYTSADGRSSLAPLQLQAAVQPMIGDLELALASDPKNPALLTDLAQLQLAVGALEKAEAYCRQAVAVDMRRREPRKILAQIYLRRHDYPMAKIMLNALDGDSSDDPMILNMLALIALQEARPEYALTLFKKTLARAPNDVASRMNLGTLYLQHRQINAAAVQFERVLQIVPEHRDAKVHMAVIAAARGQKDQAQALYEDVLAVDGGNVLASYNLAVLQLRDQNYGDAAATLHIYMKNDGVRKEDKKDVAALLAEVEDFLAAGKIGTSDAEIKKLAARLEAAAPAVVAAPAPAPVATPPSPTAAPPAAEPAAAPQIKSADDISSLEKELEL